MNQATANILLVDDQPARLLTYEAILERLGHNLVRTRSGAEALKRLDDTDFAAILLDISMPGLDGFETARRIRTHSRAAQTPIVFVTGVHITDLDRLRGYEIGAADYVYVPVIPEILRGKVQVLVQLYMQRLELSRLNEALVAANSKLEQAHEQLKEEKALELQELNRSLEVTNRRLTSEIEERRRTEELLKEAARRKDEFISILAHELRNPLSAMQGGVELLRLPNLPDDKRVWARDLLQRQLQHLVRLIDDLLDVSRITTGRVQLRKETIDVKAAVAQSLDATRPLIEERAHEVELNLPDEPLYVEGDMVRLTQVLGNLLTNAAKYMDPRGRITVSAEKTPGPPAHVLLRVRDCGYGLKADTLERIFDLFARADTPKSHAESGLGIGLALVRGLVEAHRGTVHAASDGPGCGSEFIVDLPLSDAKPLPAIPVRGIARRNAPGLRVLIIDDNVDATHGLTVYLQANSAHELRVAATGAKGVALAAEFAPDIVLLDIGLPDMDGYEVARRLRGMMGVKTSRIVALTGYGGEAYRQRAREAGFDRFLVKPIEYAALEHVLADPIAGAPVPDTRAAEGAAC